MPTNNRPYLGTLSFPCDFIVCLHFGNLTSILRQRFIAADKLWRVPDFLAKFGARKALNECSRKQQQQKSYSHIQLGFATLHATKKLFASLSHAKRSEANSKENTCCALQFKVPADLQKKYEEGECHIFMLAQ